MEEDWDLNSPYRVKHEMSLQNYFIKAIYVNPQAESATHINVPSNAPAYSAKYPDGKLPYA